ncbi:hypothetical protein AB0B12_39400 [Streptomyces sp. NPDC044780]|uniref:Uncharacterized protein n=1 Tax=Streptomyces luomodiensis TaxID=3026192 RepID=A0ABY9UTF8_9ACTN|nr:hypothetical protein [Streptomyces sp. SCA4-21]WNE95561.1 hypothetical protein PS467_09555 [Streptomyces sp. SCA4-21]
MRRRWALGECWLWCERTAVPVLWLGPVIWVGGNAPLLACERCIRHLERKTQDALTRGADPTPTERQGRWWAPGECWLWCRRTDLPTLLLGTVENADHQVPLYSCDPCIQRLEDKVRAALPYVPA